MSSIARASPLASTSRETTVVASSLSPPTSEAILGTPSWRASARTPLHHQRKGQNGTKPKTLEDVFGSTWITAGAGSVLLRWGQPGDHIVELIHLKQPAAPIGPLKIEHDHDAGTSRIYSGFDILAFLRHRRTGATALDTARAMTEKDTPTDNERRNALRQLDRLVKKGIAHRSDPEIGGSGGSSGARYHLVTTQEECPK
jgi:hypothetical protein